MNSPIKTKHVIANALLFQVMWFAAILGAWYWALVPLVLMLSHLYVIRQNIAVGITPLLVLTLIGLCFDSILSYMGIYQYPADTTVLPFLGLPLWLACLWLGFCLTLPVSLVWLLKKPYCFVLGCALLAPVSYLAGRRLAVLDFSDGHIWLLAVEWSVFAMISLILLLPKLELANASSVLLKKESTC